MVGWAAFRCNRCNILPPLDSIFHHAAPTKQSRLPLRLSRRIAPPCGAATQLSACKSLELWPIEMGAGVLGVTVGQETSLRRVRVGNLATCCIDIRNFTTRSVFPRLFTPANSGPVHEELREAGAKPAEVSTQPVSAGGHKEL